MATLEKLDLSKLNDKEKQQLLLTLRRLSNKTSAKTKLPPPKTDDELWIYIKEEAGYEIPRVAVCEDHTAPFDFVSDFYFERERSLLLLSSREAGKTLAVAIVH